MCYIILNVGLFLFYSTAVYIMCYIKLILRLFLNYNNDFCIMCFCVPNPLQYVLYHIERWTVPVLQYWCLQIDHTVVPGLKEELEQSNVQYDITHIVEGSEHRNTLWRSHCCSPGTNVRSIWRQQYCRTGTVQRSIWYNTYCRGFGTQKHIMKKPFL
jgi:hypothetical protein